MTRRVHGWAEYVDGARIRFHWGSCSHTETVDYARKPVAKRMSAEGARMMSRWWSKAKGGVNLNPCKRCAAKRP